MHGFQFQSSLKSDPSEKLPVALEKKPVVPSLPQV